MSENVVSRYGAALAGYFKEFPGLENDFFSDARIFLDMLDSEKDLKQTFNAPLFSDREKDAVFNDLAAKAGFSLSFINFYRLLIQKQRAGYIAEIITRARALLDDSLHLLEATVRTPYLFSDTELAKIRQILEKRYPEKKITVNQVLDTSLLGGALLKAGTTLFDGSLKGMLKNLKKELMENK